MKPEGETTYAFWRRLDAPGHDFCVLKPRSQGWQLSGFAVFHEAEVPAGLRYSAECDARWRTREGRVSGWLGPDPVELIIQRTMAGEWALDGKVVEGLEAVIDVDFGFTPATNLLSIRRMALSPGESADVSAALLDLQSGTLKPLAQRYERRDEAGYWYEAPSYDYAGLLEVAPSGFVLSYPGLWEMET
ncbi:MAG: hypothetical protein C4521_12155 [Actinobacteria bacterium]|nr:MAG: hypothetical protein C4521_12155 [Actinomycetota bacterium]